MSETYEKISASGSQRDVQHSPFHVLNAGRCILKERSASEHRSWMWRLPLLGPGKAPRRTHWVMEGTVTSSIGPKMAIKQNVVSFS
jgi:hypothetical protein